METLPLELKSNIMTIIPLRKIMLLNKSYQQLSHLRYCEEFEPTETQILHYVKMANNKHTSYVLFEMKTIHNEEYQYIVDINNFEVNTRLEYYSHNHVIIGKKYPFINHHLTMLTLYNEYEHQYYDLDLYSLYRIHTYYCGELLAKNWIKNKLDTIFTYVQKYQSYIERIERIENHDDFDWSDENELEHTQLATYFYYLTASALIVHLWDDQNTYHPRTTFTSDDIRGYNSQYMIKVMTSIYYLFLHFLNCNLAFSLDR